MNNIFYRHIRSALALAAVGVPAMQAVAAPVSVKAHLDSVNLMMGAVTTLRLDVVEDAGTKGHFEIFDRPGAEQGYVGVCGDSVELRTHYTTDTIQLGSGRIQVNYAIPVQSFDSGSYRLPEFLYLAKGDSVWSERVSLKVYPVQAGADDPIAGLAPVAEPDGMSLFDYLPDWMFEYWWLIFFVWAAAGVGLWYMTRPPQQRLGKARRKPEPTPYEVAIRRLGELKARKLWEQGMEKEYFTELTDILRVYLDRKFGINALEMTSRQIMDTLRANPLIKDKRDYVRRILDIADFVKFAKVRPLPADNVAAYDNAVSFIEETNEIARAAEETQNAGNKDAGRKENKS